eukprot:scaffold80407_cov63-Phaeocystis_antarctica.AAC.5
MAAAPDHSDGTAEARSCSLASRSCWERERSPGECCKSSARRSLTKLAMRHRPRRHSTVLVGRLTAGAAAAAACPRRGSRVPEFEACGVTGRARGARWRWLRAGVREESELTRREGRRRAVLAVVAVRRRVDLRPRGWWRLAHPGRRSSDATLTQQSSQTCSELAEKAARTQFLADGRVVVAHALALPSPHEQT